LAKNAVSILWVLIPLIAFIALIVVHETLLRVWERRKRAARYFQKGLARLDGTWIGTGESGERYVDAAHPYAQDLDLFGAGSVFELLCTARTRIGEDTLAGWLKAPADPATIRARQQAVSELRPRVDLREALAVVAEEARSGVDPIMLAAWGEAPPTLRVGGFRIQVWLCTALGVSGFAAGWILVFNILGAVKLGESVLTLLRDGLLVTLLVNGWFMH